jgi:putative endonuclease
MASWHVYILRCADDTLYTGITNDLDRRIEQHNRGEGARYTASRTPVALVYSEPAIDRSSAARREAAIKKLSRAEKEDLAARRIRPASNTVT